MALPLTTDERNLLREPNLRALLLATFRMDSGTYRFCDAAEDYAYGGNTYIGASAVFAAADIKSSGTFVAEPVTLTIDGNRLQEAGFTDPADFFQDILAEDFHQRRVDLHLGLKRPGVAAIEFVYPLYAGKTNYIRWVDEQLGLEPADTFIASRLEWVLDSLAARYKRASYTTRSHEQHSERWPGDDFFKNVKATVLAETTLYWGKNAPKNVTSTAKADGNSFVSKASKLEPIL